MLSPYWEMGRKEGGLVSSLKSLNDQKGVGGRTCDFGRSAKRKTSDLHVRLVLEGGPQQDTTNRLLWRQDDGCDGATLFLTGRLG